MIGELTILVCRNHLMLDEQYTKDMFVPAPQIYDVAELYRSLHTSRAQRSQQTNRQPSYADRRNASSHIYM